MARFWQSLKNIYHFFIALIALVYFRYPARHLTVIGITGTDGKTTTATLLYHLLKQSRHKVALISTVAAYIGNDRIDTGFHVTTPNSWSLQRLLAQIVQQGYTHLVLEATSHGLDQHRLLGTNIKVAIVTNVTHEHLDYHQTYNRYLTAKAKIFSSADTVILNEDDQSFHQLKSHLPASARLISYSIKTSSTTTSFSAQELKQLKIAAAHRFDQTYNQSNTLAAASAARAIGMPVPSIVSAIPSFPGVPGRMQSIENQKGIIALVDFAHTPNALKETLIAAKTMSQGKLIVVFGAAGKRDVSKRPKMGTVASELADEIIVTAEDPRGESVLRINQQIIEGATKNRGHFHSIPDRKQAIKFALKLAQPKDILILCGKGHEQTINLDGQHELPWSDVEVLSTLLKT